MVLPIKSPQNTTYSAPNERQCQKLADRFRFSSQRDVNFPHEKQSDRSTEITVNYFVQLPCDASAGCTDWQLFAVSTF